MPPNAVAVPTLPEGLLLLDPIDRGRRRLRDNHLTALELRDPGTKSWAGVWALPGASGRYAKALKLFGGPMVGPQFAKLMHLIRLDIAHYGDYTQGCCVAAAPQQLVCDIEDRVVGYSMPYVDGFAWAREQEKGPPRGAPVEWARRAEALLGLWCALHERSILHGDLQPSNMRIDPGGKRGIALIDFDEAWCRAHRAGLDEDLEVIASLQNNCPNAPKGETMCPPLVHANHSDPETWEAAGMLVAVSQLLMSSPVKKLAFAQRANEIDKREAGLTMTAQGLCTPLARDFVLTTLRHLNAGHLPWKLDECIEQARATIDALLRSSRQQLTLLGTQVIRPRPLSARQITLPDGWETDHNVGASFIRELSATPPPTSIAPSAPTPVPPTPAPAPTRPAIKPSPPIPPRIAPRPPTVPPSANSRSTTLPSAVTPAPVSPQPIASINGLEPAKPPRSALPPIPTPVRRAPALTVPPALARSATSPSLPTPVPRPTPTPPPLPIPSISAMPTLAPPSWQDLITVLPTTTTFLPPPLPAPKSPVELPLRLICGIGSFGQLAALFIATHEWTPWVVLVSHLLLVVPAYALARILNRNGQGWLIAALFVPLAPALLAIAPRQTQ